MKPSQKKPAKISAAEQNCALCPYSTKVLSRYKKHLNVHSDNRPFKCPECPFRAKSKGNLVDHVKLVHLLRSTPGSESGPLRPFPCLHFGCNYAAKRKYHLKQHSKIHSDEKFFFCSHPNCNYSTKHKQHLTEHIRIHTGEKPFVCQFESCSYATADQGSLVKHSRTHTKEKPFKCPEPNCEYAATVTSALKHHQLTHEPKEGEERSAFKCPLCEYSGNSQGNLRRHIKSHTLEKHFKCDEPNCNFEAKTRADVETHKRVHSDEKPFVCSVESCEYRCKQKSHLSTHLKSHSEERRYKCELCPFRGKTRNVVSNHLSNVHSDLRPFKYIEQQCDSAYKRKEHLNQHILNHKGEF